MKKFEINKTNQEKWTVSHNEFPKFTCEFENKKFNISRTLNELEDPMGNPTEVNCFKKWNSGC